MNTPLTDREQIAYVALLLLVRDANLNPQETKNVMQVMLSVCDRFFAKQTTEATQTFAE